MGVFCANAPMCYSLIVRLMPESWKESVASRVETFARTKPAYRTKSGSSNRGDASKQPPVKSRSVLSWVKGGSAGKSGSYTLDEIEHRSTNSDAEILRDAGKIYVRQDYEVTADHETSRNQSGRDDW